MLPAIRPTANGVDREATAESSSPRAAKNETRWRLCPLQKKTKNFKFFADLSIGRAAWKGGGAQHITACYQICGHDSIAARTKDRRWAQSRGNASPRLGSASALLSGRGQDRHTTVIGFETHPTKGRRGDWRKQEGNKKKKKTRRKQENVWGRSLTTKICPAQRWQPRRPTRIDTAAPR